MTTDFLKTFTLATVAVLATTQLAHAAGLSADEDIEPRLRARVMKEKAKQNNLLANTFNFTKSGNAPADAQCSSPNIGNVDSGSKVGAAPREFVLFAPNAMNPVSSQDCK
jgi:hypothetical protein